MNEPQSTPRCPVNSRYYQSESDLIDMQQLLMAGRLRTGDWRYWHVGELAWDWLMVACHLSAREHIRLWHNIAGELVGYAMLGEDSAFNWQVLPEYEWQGIEEQALAWAAMRLAKLRQTDAVLWSKSLVATARQDDERRIAFLQQHGFHYGGEWIEVNMLRRLDATIPQCPAPDGYRVRAVEANETAERAAAQRAVWQPWTVGDVSAEDYARFMQQPGYEREFDIVAVAPDGVIAAYVNGWLDPVNHIGDFGPVGTSPNYRRRGLGRAVLLECLRRMQASGMDRVCVSTSVSNAAARRLYESVGFHMANTTGDYTRAE